MTAAVGGTVLAASLLMAPMAIADDHGNGHGYGYGRENTVRDRGTCTVSSTYKADLQNKRDGQKLKFEVESAVAGEVWQLDITADDVLLTALTATTFAEDDDDDDATTAEAEFKTYLNPSATTVSLLATNLTTNETCTSKLTITTPVTTPLPPKPPATDPVTDPVTPPATTTTTATTTTATLTKKISRSTVAQHATTSDCWSVIGRNVYDLTSYVSQHPGGSGAIAGICGANGTSAFKAQHMNQRDVANVLSAYKLGKVKK